MGRLVGWLDEKNGAGEDGPTVRKSLSTKAGNRERRPRSKYGARLPVKGCIHGRVNIIKLSFATT